MKTAFNPKCLRGLAACQYLLMLLLVAATWFFIDTPNLPAFHAGQGGVIVIDPGHGGVDGGANRGDMLEKDFNLDIALTLRAILEDRGYTVVMTRDKDIALDKLNQSSRSRHTRDLNARVDIINKSGAALFVSIHINSNPGDPSENGSSVFYRSKSDQSRDLAAEIQKALNSAVNEAYGRKTHAPQPGRYYILSHTGIPGALVEGAFLTNAADRQLLKTAEFRRQVAAAVADGIENYLALCKKGT